MRGPRAASRRIGGHAGFTLPELLLATLLVLVLAASMAALLIFISRVVTAQPPAADEQQRLRAALDQLEGWIATAGAGLGGTGPNEGILLIPVLYPRRYGVQSPDPEDGFFRDRFTVVTAVDPPAVGLVAEEMPTRGAPIVLDLGACAPGRPGCGFGRDMRALIADARATGAWFLVTAAAGGRLTHTPADLSAAYGPADEGVVSGVEVRAVVHDVGRRALRLVTPASDQPFIDQVAQFEVRWFAEPRSPRGPVPPPGTDNCVRRADGSSVLPDWVPDTGPWVELDATDLADGPWCGAVPWRFDADLFRVRLVRVRLVLDPPMVRGARPHDMPASVQFDVAPRNLRRYR